jgi:hypothetical protein
MRTLIKIAAAAGVLFCSAAVAQSSQQGSTEAGTSYSQGSGGYGGAYARYGGHHYHHHYRR